MWHLMLFLTPWVKTFYATFAIIICFLYAFSLLPRRLVILNLFLGKIQILFFLGTVSLVGSGH